MNLRDRIDADPLLPLIIVVVFLGVVSLFSLSVVGWLALWNFVEWGTVGGVPWPVRP